jgi:NAD(P)-dependent dehydrogenase (short-subunit alcohol dehydrogenase family)
MIRAYILWALIGMVGRSFAALFVKLAVRAGHISSFIVLAIATVMAAASSVAIVVARGELSRAHGQFDWIAVLWACAVGIALTVAVNSLFLARAGPIAEVPMDLVHRVFETNVFANLALTQKIVRKFVGNGTKGRG